jgi:hypothetical protein
MPSLTSVPVDDEDDLQLCTPFTSYKNNSYLSSIEALTKALPFPLTT